MNYDELIHSIPEKQWINDDSIIFEATQINQRSLKKPPEKCGDDFLDWYATLNFPKAIPSIQTIKYAWRMIYLMILPSFGLIFYETFWEQIPLSAAIPFILNLVLNLSTVPMFFMK